VPEHLKHVQGGPGSAAVAVAAVVPVVGELVLQRRLLVPGRLGQQLSQSTLSLSLRPSTHSDVASSCQRAIAAWRCLPTRDGGVWSTGQLHMRLSTTRRTNGLTGESECRREHKSSPKHKQNSWRPTYGAASARTNQELRIAHARPIYDKLQLLPTTSLQPTPRFRPLYLASESTIFSYQPRAPCQSLCHFANPCRHELQFILIWQ
jgi:hypothetical protein